MQAKQLVILDDDKRFQHCMELLENRYLAFKIDTTGKKIITEAPRDMFVRVAKFLANSEEEFAHFFDMMYNLDGLPNSPTLWGANMQKTLLNACAVLEVRDSTEDIMEQMKNGVILQKLSSGVGYYFGDIRSRDALVQSSGGKALGAVAVMRMYNASFKEISQGGRRRGAFMAVLPVWHDEIWKPEYDDPDYIDVNKIYNQLKKDRGYDALDLVPFLLEESEQIVEERLLDIDFIRCKDDTSRLKMFNNSIGFTDDFLKAVEEDAMYQLYSPINGKLIETRKVRARDIWDAFLVQSHKNGEPSAIYIDTIQKRYPNVKTTNPCSEALLEHKEFCNLGSINLMNHLGYDENGEPDMDWKKLVRTSKTMTIFLNNVIDKNYYPDPEYQRQVETNRKIGIGIMGFADILIHHFKIKYSSPEARDLARRIIRFIHEQANRYSTRYGFKNKALTSIAPTGSIATIAGVSNGIEPIFAKKFTRTTFEGLEFDLGTLDESWVEEAHDISPMDHLQMVAAVAKHVDMGSSKTINFLSNVSKEDIGKMYLEAWKSGITGISCYRDGSRGHQPLVKCDDKQCHL